MNSSIDIAFFGSSLVSAYWNGAATYYRGIIRALADRGHRVTFFEPDILQRQQHRDLEDPDWAEVVVYSADTDEHVYRCLERANRSDVVIKASGVGIFDELLEREIALMKSDNRLSIFWDVDAPATLQRLNDNADDPLIPLVPLYDAVLTYGGGPPVCEAYRERGAAQCVPIYNAVDPQTHHPVPPDQRFQGALAFLGNRLPDREARVDRFFFDAAERLPDHRFLLGGSGWHENVRELDNVHHLGHVYTHEHNALNVTPLAVLNISRDSMADMGFSPATRVFEAAGAGACLITDAWQGIELFLEPGREVLIAEDGEAVAEHLRRLQPSAAKAIGQRALERVLSEHTYQHRAAIVEAILSGKSISSLTKLTI